VIDGAGDYISPEGKDHGKSKPDRMEFKPFGVIAIAAAIPDMGALSVLNMASNNLGELVLPDGWTRNAEEFDGEMQWVCTYADGTKQIDHPGKPEGIIALANAIPDMGAMTSLNLASNDLGVEGAKIIAACLPNCM
jgi:hypothetical protein